MLDDRTRLIFPASGVVELPLLFEPRVVRCMAAGPGGHPLTVLIDTGTDPSAIDLGLARRLGLRLGDFALGQDAASDAIPFTETVLPWLRLGDLELRDLFALAIDLSAAPFPVDLALGYNVLSRLILGVDYARRSVRFSHLDLGLPALPECGAMLELVFFEHFPAVRDVLLNEHIHIPLATIDTGSNGGLTLGPDLAAQLGLQPGAADVTLSRGSGFGGASDVVRRTARSLRLDPFTLHDIELDVLAAETTGGDLRRAGRANIGNRTLSRFTGMTLDYERRVCMLEPFAHSR